MVLVDFVKNTSLAFKLTIGAAVIVAFSTIVFFRTRPQPTVSSQIQQVTLAQGDRSITINRYGQVTIRTPQKTIMQFWDPQKVKAIFAKLADLDPTLYSQGEDGTLTLDLGDSQLTLHLSLADILALKEIQELLEILEQISESTQPTPTPTPWYSSSPSPTPTPTPTPFVAPTPTPTPSSSTSNPRQPFRCEFKDPQTGEESFVVSETVCSELLP